MGCAKDCTSENVVMIFTTENDTYELSTFADESAYIDIGEDQPNFNIKRDSTGRAYVAGHGFKVTPITAMMPCADEAQRLYDGWSFSSENGKNTLCGDIEISEECCTNRSYRDVVMTVSKSPSIGTEIDNYTFTFEGVRTR